MEEEFKSIYKQIGINIRNVRKEKKLTQNQLALMAVPKLDRAKISDIENGKEDFSFSTLLRICSVLDIDVKCIL
ncbi:MULTISPECIES: helix-turn-helix domain-containing protein [Myroides]|uniref:helix-turn-helix domain-containing protein n=1 Tax=Myroides TaxID=76831 RepID=UPI002576DCCB|nr:MULTISPECIES: helix-turn-helix transcriptional regulator [Myroides]MDM1377704.1 helix-turn-helix transcriptional regulator [Myroides marinus]MDM1385092.1 helix-turn-helix transcriptional regulator [Myroides marinus]MDM1392188.1 helix-turn-helix transcriptional regulator [Myroides marinus]MEC4028523.1 helix-turn-helix transcriptional regulator [Myroides odoratimimus]